MHCLISVVMLEEISRRRCEAETHLPAPVAPTFIGASTVGVAGNSGRIKSKKVERSKVASKHITYC